MATKQKAPDERGRKAPRRAKTNGEAPAAAGAPADKHPLMAWREKRKLTRRQFAESVGVASPTTIRRYEMGQQYPRPHIMKAIKTITNRKVREEHFTSPAARAS